MNKENDDLGGGKTLQTNCSANLCRGSDGPGTARRVFDPGGFRALPQINKAAGAKARARSAQTARRATVFGACPPYFEKVSKPAGCIAWQQGCCGIAVDECNDINKSKSPKIFLNLIRFPKIFLNLVKFPKIF
jgi:hypothetical protein